MLSVSILVLSAVDKADTSAVAVAKDLVYQDSHEWAKVEGDTATVGISDFAQVSNIAPRALSSLCEEASKCDGVTEIYRIV